MIRAHCTRAFTMLLLAGLGSACATAWAQQSGSAPAAGSGAPAAQSSAPAAPSVLQLTPAQQSYGMPKNPIVGGPVDTDLTKPLSLERAVHIALQLQNAAAIAKAQKDVAANQLVQARASYLPYIAPVAAYTSYRFPQSGSYIAPAITSGVGITTGRALSRGLTGLGTSLSGSTYEEVQSNMIGASLTIYDSGLREATVGEYRRNLFAAEYGLGDTRQAIVENVATAYYALLRDRELVRTERENVRDAQETLDSIMAQLQVGNAAQSDTFQARSNLANARVALLQAQSSYTVDQATLKNTMGIVTSGDLNLANTPVAPPSANPDPITLDQYIKTAYANRLDIKQQQEVVNSQGYALRMAHINNGVTLDATVTEGYQLNPNAGEEREFYVQATYPLFDGGSSHAAVKSARSVLEEQRRTLDQLEQTVHLNVEQSYQTRELARQSVVAGQVAVKAGQVNWDASLEKQKNGLVNVLDVLNAEVQLVSAEVSYIQAVYNYYIADEELKREVGLNDLEYLPRVPGIKSPTPLAAAAK